MPMRALLANLFEFSPIRMAARAMSGGASTASLTLVRIRSRSPSRRSSDEVRWAVIAIGAAENRIDHVVFGPFPSEDAAIEWADSNTRYWRDSYEIAELRGPGSAQR